MLHTHPYVHSFPCAHKRMLVFDDVFMHNAYNDAYKVVRLQPFVLLFASIMWIHTGMTKALCISVYMMRHKNYYHKKLHVCLAKADDIDHHPHQNMHPSVIDTSCSHYNYYTTCDNGYSHIFWLPGCLFLISICTINSNSPCWCPF